MYNRQFPAEQRVNPNAVAAPVPAPAALSLPVPVMPGARAAAQAPAAPAYTYTVAEEHAFLELAKNWQWDALFARLDETDNALINVHPAGRMTAIAQ